MVSNKGMVRTTWTLRVRMEPQTLNPEPQLLHPIPPNLNPEGLWARMNTFSEGPCLSLHRKIPFKSTPFTLSLEAKADPVNLV